MATPWPGLGLGLVAAGLGALYLLATPAVAAALLGRLDRFPALAPAGFVATPRTALVILDAGRRPGRRPHPAALLKPYTLERLIHGAWLHRRLGLPILVSGDGAGPLLADVLREDFGVTARWIEAASRNTHENAVASARLLRAEGFDRVVLVTHFWHLPRAAAAFAATGLEVVPAPLGFEVRDAWERGFLALVPRANALGRSHLACHEAVGRLWYRWRYRRQGS